MFFSEEKNQKTFAISAASPLSGHGRQVSAGVGTKVFWFFSSEKNSLPSCGRHRSFIFLQ
jgi:hypothetical protein